MTSRDSPLAETGIATRDRAKLMVLSIITALCLYLCYRLVGPFLPAIVWSVTAAVITIPRVRPLRRRFKSPGVGAGIGVATVFIALVVPIAAFVYFAAVQVQQAASRWRAPQSLDASLQSLQTHPRFGAMWRWFAENLNLPSEAQRLAGMLNDAAVAVVSGSIYTVVQALIALFILFFLYRDEDEILAAVMKYSPITAHETRWLLARLNDTVHATIYGTVLVALIQGVLAGLMFWFLGLPTPVFWGVVMGSMAIIPYLGTFVVWAPAAAYLAMRGEAGKALLLTGWGVFVVGTIDNLLYPVLVGSRLRLHTVVAFIAIVGGISIFGGAGIVLGPVLVTATASLLKIWRTRTEDGAAAEQCEAPTPAPRIASSAR